MARWMTIDQKRQIIAKSVECPSLTHAELAEWAAITFTLSHKPARSMISGILSNARRITSDAYGDGRRRKPLKVLSLRLEHRLAQWVKEYEDNNLYLSRQLIAMRARDLQGELCDAWDLNLSDGWLTRFMRRLGLRPRQLHGDAASADPKVVHQGLQSLQEITDLNAPADIYNMYETDLCYAMAPARSICTKGMRGVKKNKTRITLALTANADGSDALPILYFGRSKKPRCFRTKKPEECGFKYRSDQKAWMTGVIFREWLSDLDRDIRATGRHILLRRKQLEWVYGKMKRHEDIDKKTYAVDQRRAMEWSNEIWQDMQKTRTISNCFHHTGVVFNGVNETLARTGTRKRRRSLCVRLS